MILLNIGVSFDGGIGAELLWRGEVSGWKRSIIGRSRDGDLEGICEG